MGETLRANRKDLIDLCLPPGLNAFLENNFVQLVVPNPVVAKTVSKTTSKKPAKIKISSLADSSELDSDEEISPFRINKRCRRMRAKAAEAAAAQERRRAVIAAAKAAAASNKTKKSNEVESDSHSSSSEDDVVELFRGGKTEKKSNQISEEKKQTVIAQRKLSLFNDSEDSD